MGAAVVRRDHLDVFVPRVARGVLVLDAGVGEMDVVVEVRQVVLPSPGGDLLRRAVGSAVAVGAATVALLQEALVVALQLVVEHDAAHAPALAPEAFLRAPEGAVDLRVVGQLSRLPEARVEGLPGLVWAPQTMRLEQLATAVGEDHDVPLPAIQGDALQQTRLLQPADALVG